MKWTRVTMRGLIGLVAIIAIVIAAPRQASQLSASLVLTGSIVLLCWAILGALWSATRPRRVFWSSFALFGWLYLILVLIPGLRAAVGIHLTSQKLVPLLQQWFTKPLSKAPAATNPFTAVVWVKRNNTAWINEIEVDVSQSDAIESALMGKQMVEIYVDPGADELAGNILQLAQKTRRVEVSTRPSWSHISQDTFQRIADPILAILFGIGAGIAARFCWGGHTKESAPTDIVGPNIPT